MGNVSKENLQQAEILDSGVIGSENQLRIVIADLISRGAQKAMVAEKENISHWWLLETPDGLLIYLGTPASFSKFAKTE